jgi:hypothetical protein
MPHRALATAAVLSTATVAVAACGGAQHRPTPTPTPPVPPPATAYSTHGLTVALPSGWRVAHSNLTPNLADPRERLSVATFPLHARQGRCAQFPAALSDVGPRDALVTLQEQSGRITRTLFPQRPARFDLDTGTALTEATACSPTTPSAKRWMSFSDHGRNFYALVAIGPQATAATRAAAFRILDGLRVAAR